MQALRLVLFVFNWETKRVCHITVFLAWPKEHNEKCAPSLVRFMYILVSVLFKLVRKIEKQLMDDMNYGGGLNYLLHCKGSSVKDLPWADHITYWSKRKNWSKLNCNRVTDAISCAVCTTKSCMCYKSLFDN